MSGVRLKNNVEFKFQWLSALMSDTDFNPFKTILSISKRIIVLFSILYYNSIEKNEVKRVSINNIIYVDFRYVYPIDICMKYYIRLNKN